MSADQTYNDYDDIYYSLVHDEYEYISEGVSDDDNTTNNNIYDQHQYNTDNNVDWNADPGDTSCNQQANAVLNVVQELHPLVFMSSSQLCATLAARARHRLFPGRGRPYCRSVQETPART